MLATKILTALDIECDIGDIKTAAMIIKSGGLVAIPTETVYGLAADAINENAVKNIFTAKGRPQDNPLIVHIAELSTLYTLAREVPQSAELVAEKFWPGALTIILKKTPIVPYVTSGGLETVAIRMPSHPVAREVIRLSAPLAAPSANLSGSPSPTTAKHCIEDLKGRVDAILCGDDCKYGVESTVLDLTGDIPRVLRPGAVTVEELRQVLGKVEIDDAVFNKLSENEKASSPGMKYKHYSPKADITIIDGDFDKFAEYINSLPDENQLYCLVFEGEEDKINKNCLSYGSQNDGYKQAHELFTKLRELDEINAKRVYARCPSKDGVGLAVYNRLIRAAGFEVMSL